MKKLAIALILLLATPACSISNQHSVEIQPGLDVSTPAKEVPPPAPQPLPPAQLSGDLVSPDDFEYLGAFRLPGGEDRPQTFAYGGNAMTYNPDGNSLFIMGHDRMPYGDLPDGNHVAEISIPKPVISKNIEDLNTAEFIQKFSNVLKRQFSEYDEIPKAGMQYLSRAETGAKIHVAFGEHLQSEQIPTHGWFSPTLSIPDFQGTWFIGNQDLYSVNGYMFEIPAEWAEIYTGGRPLGTGRMRDGGQGGMGPTLFAYRPWNADGSPLPASTRLDEVTLLLYENAYNTEEIVRSMDGYQHPDEWGGGAWLTTSGGKAAVLFAGTKSNGEKYWYGYIHPDGANLACVDAEVTDFPTCRMADGSVCPQEDYTACCDAVAGECVSNRGWWTTRFDAEFILYDPADLAKVATGQLEPWQPQPYAVIDIDEHLFLSPPEWDLVELGWSDQRRSRIGDVAFDRQNGLLYVLELYGDGTKPVVHLWKVH